MQGIGIKFEWEQFADYTIKEKSRSPSAANATILAQASAGPQLIASGNSLIIKPLDVPDLYLKLAQSEPTIAGHQAFAKKFGLLTNRRQEFSFDWEERVEGMRKLIALVEDKANWEIRNGEYAPYQLPKAYNLQFAPDGVTGQMTLSIVPNDLYAALVLQCISNRAGGGSVRSCKACGSLFQTGGTSGRRSHREFCSDKCRFDFSHRSRRGKQ